MFTPPGFNGAGDFKLLSYNGGGWYDATLTADGSGTYDVSGVTLASTPGRGPEGAVYVAGSNSGFGVNSVLMSEYSTGSVGAYDLDSNGDPIVGTRRDFLTGLTGAEGAAIDPLTGDFLFSTYGGGNSVYVVNGFAAPPAGIPEPASWALMLGGFGLVGAALRRRRTMVAA